MGLYYHLRGFMFFICIGSEYYSHPQTRRESIDRTMYVIAMSSSSSFSILLAVSCTCLN